MSRRVEHDDRPSGPADDEIARGWARLRVQIAVLLMFSGAVALFALVLDRVVEPGRPTRPLVAVALGTALLAAGYGLGRGGFGSLFNRVPTTEPSPTPAVGTAGDLWALVVGPAAAAGLALYGPFWGDPWFTLGGVAFLGVWAVAMSGPFLAELARRGDWVPPSTARHPGLVAVALTALVAAAVVAALLALVWLERVTGLAN